jgi:hypothetical protein
MDTKSIYILDLLEILKDTMDFDPKTFAGFDIEEDNIVLYFIEDIALQ